MVSARLADPCLQGQRGSTGALMGQAADCNGLYELAW